MEFFHISYLQHEKEIIIADLKLDEIPKAAFSPLFLEKNEQAELLDL